MKTDPTRNTGHPPHDVHYEVNVCGGTFDSVRDRFRAWQHEPLIVRPQRTMFENKDGVKRLDDDTVFDLPEAAQQALRRACTPGDRYALAAPVVDDGRALWLVMAAYVA
ncbi:hypothetical protein [Burkholderia sp. Ac-20379]|uniref:hypothetical protein n=1 Tax=Burkholderia sp. Ac-20379 TaxID=2703900 RepID=UPI00198064BA|nr:hypothetical protein [Burkholderia sp. Ac-20379]MBN3723919.1 hypothetical protein [Burkholderia sp. Ac-20379]